MKTYIAYFRRAPVTGEIGPGTEKLETEAPSKTRAAQWARSVAKERDWRFMEVREK